MAGQDRELHIECNSVSSSTLPRPPKGLGSDGVLRQCFSTGLSEYTFQMLALVWRILACATAHKVVLKGRHIPGRLNVMADSLSKQGKFYRQRGLCIQ